MDNRPWGQVADGSARGNVPPRLEGVRRVEKNPECISETFLWSWGSTLGHGASWVSSMGLQEQNGMGCGSDHRDAWSPDLEARSRCSRGRVSPSGSWSRNLLRPFALVCGLFLIPLSSGRLPSVLPMPRFPLPRSQLRLSAPISDLT